MNTIISNFTETRNPFVNSLVAIVVTFIVVSAMALLTNVIVNGAPEIGFNL